MAIAPTLQISRSDSEAAMSATQNSNAPATSALTQSRIPCGTALLMRSSATQAATYTYTQITTVRSATIVNCRASVGLAEAATTRLIKMPVKMRLAGETVPPSCGAEGLRSWPSMDGLSAVVTDPRITTPSVPEAFSIAHMATAAATPAPSIGT